MHVIFRENRGLDGLENATDLGQSPAPLVVLSFSDSDLSAFAAGWQAGQDTLPALRLANLAALKHPLSVDTYIERTLSGCRAVLVRLIGGAAYWRYGLEQLNALTRSNGMALAVIPADGRADPTLDALSTVPTESLRSLTRLCDTGGATAAHAALCLLAQTAGLPAPLAATVPAIPDCGWYQPHSGVVSAPPEGTGPLAVIVFYRAYLTSADTAPIDALAAPLHARGFRVAGVFAPSLKGSAAPWLRAALMQAAPAVIVNATAFSGQDAAGASPLDAPECPVFQIALATSSQQDWEDAERGLSPADLAMHVVLPEVDGRIIAGVASFKALEAPDPNLQFARALHHPVPDRIEAIANKVAAWHRLAITPNHDRAIAFVLSTYPGRTDQMAHAVGLDALASTEAMLTTLAAEGYTVTEGDKPLSTALSRQKAIWPVTAYKAALQGLPPSLREPLVQIWGEPEQDPAVSNGAFHFALTRRGHMLVALQPERGRRTERDADYHDTARIPCHAYVAFYLWLHQQGLHALVHVGAHGTLEWLPGKAVALSQTCWPEVLCGAMPVIYPFIVNDPGEAAQARRRIGALTLGHLPPAMVQANVPEGFLHLERLLDEYATADGLDPARRNRLIPLIRAEARATGVEADLGLDAAASPAEAMVRIDRFVCDLKESQFGEGLHVYGRGEGETRGLLRALAGFRVEAGPSGSPARGRTDVLPTGRNLYAVDPRAVPSRAAHAQGVKLAEEFLRRHLQDHGDWPKGLVIDLWGSATMRTAGEEFAMALHLAGLAPLWEPASERVSGFEILPPVLLERPRIDVTLRVSGLFRDIFPDLARLFDAATGALAERTTEDMPDNPYRRRIPRVFGPRPGTYGLSMADPMEQLDEQSRHAAGEAWLRASEWSMDATGAITRDRAALEERLRTTDTFAHIQDLPETDLLLARDYAAHEGGFSAAMSSLGCAQPAQYHLDTTRADRPQARTLGEELARIVRARATSPVWAAGMMRHGFRGAAEITATLDNLAAFAHLTRQVPAHLFDLYFEATLGRDDVSAFMERENPAALVQLRERFQALATSGLWQTRSNSIHARLDALS
ncbi:cobaltochelatase subunit CobN [Acetobacter peroxydans]|jgi:cobaltochelatase CobN|uniref:cobaltochelatase subunit CobN n=1 Tax=Acetobacter peroxydans TaxID=104098 RepID=UPI002353F7FB|nr:cobaltochelatase subunit CobN [Acetobacter peroxydans]MCH4143544.1 cobaltochelatase subunit CobN [Acetobacter peroxydans]MCI1394520.1 cobaltochelatase subunit CobN [Acetobacter peroxydans]MCI1411400.1 cobaltochelatase subunit CobN [Acetobacter peroxydans]MCI1566497.1 cobaltochelatase subunit CobN [Acetobacter peroxydans]MCI1618712.1 cobaltochelatase subunit CobN [Acetobacter peroxydans]